MVFVLCSPVTVVLPVLVHDLTFVRIFPGSIFDDGKKSQLNTGTVLYVYARQ